MRFRNCSWSWNVACYCLRGKETLPTRACVSVCHPTACNRRCETSTELRSPTCSEPGLQRVSMRRHGGICPAVVAVIRSFHFGMPHQQVALCSPLEQRPRHKRNLKKHHWFPSWSQEASPQRRAACRSLMIRRCQVRSASPLQNTPKSLYKSTKYSFEASCWLKSPRLDIQLL